MSALAKKIIIIVSIIAGVLTVVGASMAVLLSKPTSTIARSDRLDTPIIKGVEREGNNYLLSFSYISDAIGYRVSEYDTINDERHTQTYSGSAVKYAGGEYVKVDITDFLFATHTEDDFKDYTFTVLARYSDAVFDSKESEQFVYSNKITLDTPEINTINPQSSSVKWSSVEFATSYTVHLIDEDDSNDSTVITTSDTYVTFDRIKEVFGEQTSYMLGVVAQNKSITKQGFILDSEMSATAEYVAGGKVADFKLTYDEETNKLSWDKPAGADYYSIFISTYGTSEYANSIDNKGLFQITDSAVVCDLSSVEYVKYIGEVVMYVVAHSSNQYVESTESNEISATNTIALESPSNIAVESDSTYLRITWNAPSTNSGLVSGYKVTIYNYTAEQAENADITSAPYNHLGQVVISSDDTSLTEYTAPLSINSAGFYGVAVSAMTNNSYYTNSKDAYYKNEAKNNLNVYNANKVLEAPKGIVARENADGTISVSWNIVENARRYIVKINMLDSSGNVTSSRTTPVVDTRQEFNRVNTTIPPQTMTDLVPGRYTIEVSSETDGYYTSNGVYNSSVSYPDGQSWVSYRLQYDTDNLNLTFDKETQTLSWNNLASLEAVYPTAYAVTVQLGDSEEQTIATVIETGTASTISYSMAEFFADYKQVSGDYDIWVVLKGQRGENENYRVDTASDKMVYTFKQTYVAPKDLQIVGESPDNARTLSWSASVNANESTTYTVKINGETIIEDFANTSLDVTDNLSLGANTIEVCANEDDVNKQSASVTLDYTYYYTLTKINGDVTIDATAVEYSTPIIKLNFEAVTNAQSYVITINDNEGVNYSASVLDGTATITLSDTDTLKLTPFGANTISITPSNLDIESNINNEHIIVADDISTNVDFTNNYYLPILENVKVSPTSFDTHIIAKINEQNIALSFGTLTLNNENIQNYQVVIADADGNILNTYDFTLADVTFDSETNLYSLDVFDLLKSTNNANELFRGKINVGVSAVKTVEDNNSYTVVSPSKFATLLIFTGAGDVSNVVYEETSQGMILSWDSVEGATEYSFSTTIDTGEYSSTFSAVGGARQTLDLRSVFYNQQIGAYEISLGATVSSTIDGVTHTNISTASTNINIVKKLQVFDILPQDNNQTLKITAQNLPRTLYGDSDNATDYVYATGIMLVFDSVDGVEYALNQKVTDASELANYRCTVVNISDTSQDLDINISGFTGAQTCYVYAFNTDKLASFSDYVTVDLSNVVRYVEPVLTISDDDNEMLVEWGVEYITSGESQVAPKSYDFDVLSRTTGKSVLTSDNITVSGGTLSANSITTNSDATKIECTISGLKAGNYIVKVRANTANNAIANSSNYTEQTYSFEKLLPNVTSVTVAQYDTTDNKYGEPQNLTELSLSDYSTQNKFRLYWGQNLQKIDEIELKNLALTVKTSTQTVVNAKHYALTETNKDGNGYYFELTKSILGIYSIGIYDICVNYVSPTPAYIENDPTTIFTLTVLSIAEEDVSVKDVVITETEGNLTVSWTPATYGTNTIPVSYTIDGTTGTTDDPSVTVNKTTIDTISTMEITLQSDISADSYAELRDANPINSEYNVVYVINNYNKKFAYTPKTDGTEASLTITLDNKISLNSTTLTAVSLNGRVYDASTFTKTVNTITFTNTTDNAIVDSILSDVLPTLNDKRTVNVILYVDSDIVYDDAIDEFPVLINKYVDSTTIEMVNDNLVWDAVPYAVSYKIYGGTTEMTSLVNSIALSDIFGASGNYDVYVEAIGDSAKNIYVKDGDYHAETITYIMPYESVKSLSYASTVPNSFVDGEDYQYIKTLTWTLTSTIANPVFNVNIVSSDTKLKLTIASEEGDTVDAVYDRKTNEDGTYTYTVDLSSILNGIKAGNYTVSVVVCKNEADNYSDSKPTSTVIENRKFISIPSADWQDYITVSPTAVDDLTYADNDLVPTSTTIAFASAFNEKIFTLKQTYPYATRVRITLKSDDETLSAVMDNIVGNQCKINITQSDYVIIVTLFYDKDSDTLGAVKYFDTPSITYNDITVDSDTKTVARQYSTYSFDYMEAVPTYNITDTSVAWQEGVSGANSLELTISNRESSGSYIVSVVDANNSVSKINYDTTVLATKSLNDIMADRGLPYGKYTLKIAKLGREYVEGESTNSHYITSFYGEAIDFDYHYNLGNILEVKYNEEAGTLEWGLLSVDPGISVNYVLTLTDSNNNSIPYNGVVKCAQTGDSVTYSVMNGDGFTIEGSVLKFAIATFANDTSSRSNYYLVGDYSYNLYAYDGSASTIVSATEPSENNIISNETISGAFTYKTAFPIDIINASLTDNTLAWNYRVTNLGLSLNDGEYNWEYTINGKDWKALKDVELSTEVTTIDDIAYYTASTGILLDYTTRKDILQDNFKIRVNMFDTLYTDTDGTVLTTFSLNPKLPNIIYDDAEAENPSIIDTSDAKTLKFKFDFANINNTTAGSPYFVGDLDRGVWSPKLKITLTSGNKTYEDFSQIESLSDKYKTLPKNTSNLTCSSTIEVDITQLINNADDIIQQGELIPGKYTISITLTNALDNQYYNASDTFTQDFVILPRWQVSNIQLNADNQDNNITYYYEICDSADKGASNNKAQNWLNNRRKTVLSFDITNPTDNETDPKNLQVVAWLTSYNDYINNNYTLVISGEQNACNVSSVSVTVDNNNKKWSVSVDLTSIWTTVTKPLKYFIVFKVVNADDTSSDSVGRRESLTTVHSQSQKDYTVQDDEQGNIILNKKYTIVHYKWLANVTLDSSFNMTWDNDNNKAITSVHWNVINKSQDSIYSFVLNITEVRYVSSSSSASKYDEVLGGLKKSYTNITGELYQLKDTLKNGACYMVTIALSDNVEDSYYISDGNDKTSSTDTKCYIYLALSDAPSNLDITNGTSLYTSDDYQLNNLADNTKVLVLDEGTDTTKAKPTITFDALSDVDSYKLVVTKDNVIVNTYIFGKDFSSSDDTKIYMYYYLNEDEYKLYTDEQNMLITNGKFNPSQVYYGKGKNTETAIGDISNGKITINALTFADLFGQDVDNEGGIFTVSVSAWRSSYEYARPIDYEQASIKPSLNTSINDINLRATCTVNYYIKFVTPTISASVVVDNDNVKVVDNNYVVQNKEGKYKYTLQFTITNIGDSTLNKQVAIFLHDSPYDLSNALIVDVATGSNILTVQCEIGDSNVLKFANLVNESLPSSLSFHAMILPKLGQQNWVNALSDGQTMVPTTGNTNKFVSGTAINSDLSEGSTGIVLGIQLPKVNYVLYVNQTSTGTDGKMVKMDTGGKNLYTLRNQTGSNTYQYVEDANIAVDPYLGVNANSLLGSRAYLKDKIFKDSSSRANYTVIITDNSINDDSKKTKTFTFDKVYDNITKLSANLYEWLESNHSNGAEVILEIQLRSDKDSNYITSEPVTLGFTFYVRSDLNNSNTLTITPSGTYVETLSYIGTNTDLSNNKKYDFLYQSITAELSPTNAPTDTSTNYKMLVKLYYEDKTPYYFVSSNTNDMVNEWLKEKYHNNTNNFKNNSTVTVPNDLLFVEALMSGIWYIDYTVIPTNATTNPQNYYACDYFNTKNTYDISKQTNNVSNTILKLKSTQITITKSAPSISDSTTANGKTYDNNVSIDVRPKFSGVNTSARVIKWRVMGYEDVYTILLDKLDDANSPLGLTNSTLANDSEQVTEFVKDILTFFKAHSDILSGKYEIQYYYSYYTDEDSNRNRVYCLDSDSFDDKDITYFTYTYYKVVDDEKPVGIYKVDTSANNDDKFVALSTFDGTVMGKEFVAWKDAQTNILGSMGSYTEGIVVYFESAIKNIKADVYLQQKAYTNTEYTTYTTYYSKQQINSSGEVEVVEVGTCYYYWYFFPFSSSKAAALDNTPYTNKVAENLQKSYVPNKDYLGYVQGGSNNFFIAYTYEDENNTGTKTYVSIGKFNTKSVGYVTSGENRNVSYIINASKYLKFTEYNVTTGNSTFNFGDADTVADKVVTALVGAQNTDEHDGLTICPECLGAGILHVEKETHRVVDKPRKEITYRAEGADSITYYYTCADCGMEQKFINKVHGNTESLKFSDGICKYDKLCTTCHGTGSVTTTEAKLYWYEQVISESSSLGQYFKDNYSDEILVSWMPTGVTDKSIMLQVATATKDSGEQKEIEYTLDNEEKTKNVNINALHFCTVSLTPKAYLSNVTLNVSNNISMRLCVGDNTYLDKPTTTKNEKGEVTETYYSINADADFLKNSYCQAVTFKLQPKQYFKGSFSTESDTGDTPSLSVYNTRGILSNNAVKITFTNPNKPEASVNDPKSIDNSDMFSVTGVHASGDRNTKRQYFSFSSRLKLSDMNEYNLSLGYEWIAEAYFDGLDILGHHIGDGTLNATSDKAVSIGVLVGKNGTKLSSSRVYYANPNPYEITASYYKKGGVWEGANQDQFNKNKSSWEIILYCNALTIGDGDTYKFLANSIGGDSNDDVGTVYRLAEIDVDM